MIWSPKRIAALVVLGLCLVLISHNWLEVEINVFFWRFTGPMLWVLLGVFLLGALVRWLLPHLLTVTRLSRDGVVTDAGDV